LTERTPPLDPTRARAWRVVLVGVGVQLLHFGLFQQAYGVYVPVLVEAMGFSVASLGLLFALHQAVGGVIGPLQGRVLARLGTRKLALTGTLLLAGAMFGMASANSFAEFALYFLLGALGQFLSGFLTLTTAVVAWFGRLSSLPLSLMQTGLSLGGAVVPLVAWALNAHGHRTVLAASGVLVLVVGLLLSAGLAPGPYAPSSARARDGSIGRMHRWAVRSRAFRLIAGGHAMALAVLHGVNVYLVLFLIQRGYSLTAASLLIAVSTVAMLVGQVGGGLLGLRLSGRGLTAGCMVLQALALLLLVFAPGLWALGLFAVMHGFAWGLRGPLMQAMRVEYFGAEVFARVMGTSLVPATAGAVLGPYLVGLAGSAGGIGFEAAFLSLSVVALLGAGMFAAAAPPAPFEG
jgi:MFS family permease